MKLLATFRSHTYGTLDEFIRGESDFDKAKMLIPFFYYFMFFIAFTHIEGLDYAIAQGDGGFLPRWPLFWSSHFTFTTVVTIVYLSNTLTALLAAFFPYSRTARVAAALGFLTFHAYNASFGGPNHQWDHWLWVSFILLFLPAIKEPSPATKRIFSLVFWCALAYLLLTYSMAGIGKLIYGVIQLSQGQANAFFPDAGALYAATQLNQMGISTPLGPVIIAHPYLAWLPFLVMLELQTFSIIAAFRPQLHRLWGAGLILFHLGTFLTMRAVFVGPSALLLIFLLSSPFAPQPSLYESAIEIPLVGPIIKFATKRI